MFADMEELAKQQALFDRERGQAEQDRESMTCEREEMKRLSDQLAQIATFKNTQISLSLPDRPATTEVTSGEQSQSRRHHKAASPLHWSNSTVGRVLIPAQRIDLIILGGKLSSSVSKISISSYKSETKKYATSLQIQSHRHWCIQFSLLEDILKYEFPNKLMILTFDCYSGQSDLVQHPVSIRTRWWSIPEMTPSCVRSSPSAWGGSLWLVLLPFVTLNRGLRRSHEVVSLNIFLVKSSSRTTITPSIKMRLFDSLQAYIGYF